MKKQLKTTSFRLALLCGAASLGAALAQPSTLVPNVFTPGTPIKAADMNANFSALATGIQAITGPTLELSVGGGPAISGCSGNGSTACFQVTAVGNNLAQPDIINWSTTPTVAPKIGTYNAGVYTAGAAGVYLVDVQLTCGLTNCFPSVEVNSGGFDANMLLGTATGSFSSLTYGAQFRGTLNHVILLKAGDTLRARCMSASSAAGVNLLVPGSFFRIVKLN